VKRENKIKSTINDVDTNDFIYPSQLGGLKFKSMTDAGIALIYIIRTGWVKNLLTSTLAFDIAQFFLLLIIVPSPHHEESRF